MKPPGIAARPSRERFRFLTRFAFVAIAIAGPLLCLSWLMDLFAFSPGPLDLRVYRDIAASWMGGTDLYDARVTEVGLSFTYPPFAAVLLAPLAAISLPIAMAFWSIACLFCVYAVAWWSYRESPVSPPTFFAVAGALMASAPVWDTVAFGRSVFISAAHLSFGVRFHHGDTEARPYSHTAIREGGGVLALPWWFAPMTSGLNNSLEAW